MNGAPDKADDHPNAAPAADQPTVARRILITPQPVKFYLSEAQWRNLRRLRIRDRIRTDQALRYRPGGIAKGIWQVLATAWLAVPRAQRKEVEGDFLAAFEEARSRAFGLARTRLLITLVTLRYVVVVVWFIGYRVIKLLSLIAKLVG